MALLHEEWAVRDGVMDQFTDCIRMKQSVINCVWETKGKYGLNIILGTLLGANRARLKELRTTECRT